MIGNWVLHESTWNKWAYMEMKSPDDLNHLGNDKKNNFVANWNGLKGRNRQDIGPQQGRDKKSEWRFYR